MQNEKQLPHSETIHHSNSEAFIRFPSVFMSLLPVNHLRLSGRNVSLHQDIIPQNRVALETSLPQQSFHYGPVFRGDSSWHSVSSPKLQHDMTEMFEV